MRLALICCVLHVFRMCFLAVLGIFVCVRVCCCSMRADGCIYFGWCRLTFTQNKRQQTQPSVRTVADDKPGEYHKTFRADKQHLIWTANNVLDAVFFMLSQFPSQFYSLCFVFWAKSVGFNRRIIFGPLKVTLKIQLLACLSIVDPPKSLKEPWPREFRRLAILIWSDNFWDSVLICTRFIKKINLTPQPFSLANMDFGRLVYHE